MSFSATGGITPKCTFHAGAPFGTPPLLSLININPPAISATAGTMPPNCFINGVNMSSQRGWTIPTDREIAGGANPHYKILPGDNEKCVIAKNIMNSQLNDVFMTHTNRYDQIGQAIMFNTTIESHMINVHNNCK
jgi:hypothetical protein